MTTGTERVRPIGLDLLQHFQAVDLGQLQVQQHHGRVAGHAVLVLAATVQVVQRLGAVASHDDVVGQLALGEGRQRQLEIFQIVFDQQDGPQISHRRYAPLRGNAKAELRALIDDAVAPRSSRRGARRSGGSAPGRCRCPRTPPCGAAAGTRRTACAT